VVCDLFIYLHVYKVLLTSILEGATIYAGGDSTNKIGIVTSGTFSPTLKKPLAMGYVKTEFSEPGKEVSILVRKNLVPATVTKMPFVPTRYYQPKSTTQRPTGGA
jgi:glycine cleavage system aminomethyltransferase T